MLLRRVLSITLVMFFILGAALSTTQPAQAAPSREVVTYTYTSSPNQPVPDATSADSPVFTSDVLNVVETGTIRDVNVYVDVEHGNVFDLVIELEHAGASTVLLMSKTGDDCNNVKLTFDDDAGVGLPSCSGDSTNYPTGAYKPVGSLGDFKGLEVAGGWTLKVGDQYPDDSGTLKSWRIEITFDATGGPGRIADGRENGYDIWATSAIYCETYGVDVYAIDAGGSGTLAFQATPEEINALGIPAEGSTPDQMLIKEGMGHRLYRLPDGQFQVNSPANGDPNGYVFIWQGCGF